MTRLPDIFLGRPLAHRGLHDATRGVIENSMQAVQAAIAQGYGIEVDVQPSADETPMVFHDYMMKRLTGDAGPIHGRTTAELAKTRLVGSTDTIPTLSDVLAEVAGRVPILIEIKDQDMRLGPDIGTLQSEVCNIVRDYTGPVALMSFNPHVMASVKAQLPDTPIGLVTDPFNAKDWPNVPDARRAELVTIPDAEILNVDFISHNRSDLGSAPIRGLKTRGLPILCWTVRSAEEERDARKIADNITFEGFLPA